MLRLVMLVTLGVLVSGCATAEIKKIDPDSDAEGLRFFQPRPYLLVSAKTVDSTSVEYTTEIVWLPDYSEAYVVKPSGRIGKADLTVTLTNGWNLTNFTLNRDASVPTVVDETIGTLVSLLKPTEDFQEIQPRLYRLDFDAKGHLTGLTRFAPK